MTIPLAKQCYDSTDIPSSPHIHTLTQFHYASPFSKENGSAPLPCERCHALEHLETIYWVL